MSKIVEVADMERRRDRRRETLLEGRLQGHPVSIVDVSLGGLGAAVHFVGHVDGWVPDLGGDSTLELLADSGEVHSFEVEVVRCDPVDGHFGVRFLSLDDHQYGVVERLVMGRKV